MSSQLCVLYVLLLLLPFAFHNVMTIKFTRLNERFWLYSSLVSLSILYLDLVWKMTGDMDRLTTDGLFCAAILWLLWRKRDRLNFQGSLVASCFGLCLITAILYKTLNLFWFESSLLSLVPFSAAIAIALIAAGFKGLYQYRRELFFAWFLFFPTGVIGYTIDRYVRITVLNAKVATYILYYFGFDVASQGNEVLLSLSGLGNFRAVVDYPCAGVPMILLMLKLALLLIAFIPFDRVLQITIPLVSVAIGFILGVIRVCILTLMIPQPKNFDYWHGSNGSQIFSTLGIIIFATFCHCLMQRQTLQAATTSNSPKTTKTLQHQQTINKSYKESI